MRPLRMPQRGLRLLVGLFVLCAVGLAFGRLPAFGGERAVVRYVIDGDTVVLQDGRHVRYLGINAPEVAHRRRPGEPLGPEATLRNRQLVQGRAVTLERGPEPRDRFGRLLAFVFLPDGTLVNERLVEEGMASVCLFRHDLPYTDRLLAAQTRAMARRNGLWALPAKAPERYYVGNRGSLRFHRPWCPYGRKTGLKNRVLFSDRLRAFREGYCPCKTCWP